MSLVRTMEKITEKQIEEYRKIARQLGYPREVMEKLGRAKTEGECIRIMQTAREESITYGGRH